MNCLLMKILCLEYKVFEHFVKHLILNKLPKSDSIQQEVSVTNPLKLEISNK